MFFVKLIVTLPKEDARCSEKMCSHVVNFLHESIHEHNADKKSILIELSVCKSIFSEEMCSQIVDFLHKPLHDQYSDISLRIDPIPDANTSVQRKVASMLLIFFTNLYLSTIQKCWVSFIIPYYSSST